jgi:16S rRNA (guanine(966)-N(2))-methyltransferase RsmD
MGVDGVDGVDNRMMRVIAGLYRSRQLKGKPPAGIRPTSDKLRETLFNVLGPRVEGTSFLDGFAGMGGVGIEAISRGARMVWFVDQSHKAATIIRENLASLEVMEGFRIIEADLVKTLDVFERERTTFDNVFMDPPYERETLYSECLSAFGERSLLNEGSVLVMEHSKRVELPDAEGRLLRYRVLIQGDSTLSFYRAGY